MDNVSCNDTDHSSGMVGGYSSDWHPLSSGWLEGLPEDMKAIAGVARQSLLDNNRNERELAEATLLMQDWKSNGMLTANMHTIPKVIRQEQLGCQLELSVLIEFLLTHDAINGFRHYEFVALALLQEIRGLSELEVVAGKNDLISNTQYLTLRIAKLHIALLFLRMMGSLPSEHRDMFEEMAAYLFQDKMPQL